MAQGEAGEFQTVFASANDREAERVRVAAPSPEALIEAIEEELSRGLEPQQLLVVLDSAAVTHDGGCDLDVVIALGAVLVERGVTAIETVHTRSVRRLFDTHAAIIGASLEAIAQ